MNLSTLAPIDYSLQQPVITPVTKRMQDVMTLADMMDKRKINKMAIAKAQREEEARRAGAEQAAETLRSFEAGPTTGYLRDAIPEPVRPVEPQRVAPIPLTETGLAPAPEPQVIGRMNLAPEPMADRMAQQQTAAIQATAAPIQEQSADANFAANQAKYAEDMQKYGTEMGQYKTAQAADEIAKQDYFAKQAPMAEDKIPAAYKWMQPDEYKTYLQRSTVDPDLGEAYIDKLVTRRKGLAETNKLLEEATEKDKTAAESRRLDMEMKRHELVSNVFSGAKTTKGDYDPESVKSAITRARALGFDATRLPDNPTKDQIDDWIAEDVAMKKDKDSKDPYTEQKARFNQEKDLRDSFQNQSKAFVVMRDQYARMMSLDTSNPAGQIGMIYSIMKLYDPGSVVRETEYATAQNAAGVPTVVRNMWNKVLNGEFLSDKQIKEFKGQAGNLYKSAEDSFGNLKNHYSKVSMDYGIKPTNVTGGLDISRYDIKEVK